LAGAQPQNLLRQFTCTLADPLAAFKGPTSKGREEMEGGDGRRSRGEVRLPNSKFLDPPMQNLMKFGLMPPELAHIGYLGPKNQRKFLILNNSAAHFPIVLKLGRQ